MGRQDFIKKASEHLNEMNIPHQIGKNADISISAKFKKKQDDDDNSVGIMYFATLFVDEEKSTVYAYERATEGNDDISKIPGYNQTVVNREDGGDDSDILIGSIIGTLQSIAKSSGLSFKKTDDEKTASYPPGYIPLTLRIADVDTVIKKSHRFCTKCGSKMNANARFCPKCGSDSKPGAAKQAGSNIPQAVPAHTIAQPSAGQSSVNNKAVLSATKKKKPFALIIIIVVILVVALVAVAILLGKNSKSGENDTNPGQTASNGSESGLSTSDNQSESSSSKDSAVVSSGVRSSDLGNIMNGQYYFATDEYIFYSSFDKGNKAHIYSVTKDDNELNTIFDGFGWSLVVVDDWLYFSGNQGEAIDGTYNIFRMKFDGSQLERITNEYSYGMSTFGDHLYYMKRDSNYNELMSVCRSSLDGKNEEVLFPNGLAPVIFENQLYYHDNQGNMFRTEPDGTKSQVLLTAVVKIYVLSGGKIVYVDHNDNIYSCDLDGGNNELIRSSKGVPISNVNAYKDRIYFAEYDVNFDYSAYGYNYTIKSCKMDGSDEMSVFSSVSYGIYMNIVNKKLMCMDYVRSETSEVLSAQIKVMNLDGSNLETLAR